MTPRRMLRRISHLLGRARFERELGEELAYHLELKVAEKVAAGVEPAYARAEAARELGNLTRAREDSREAWGFVWLDSAVEDTRYAARWLVKHPVFAVATTLTLGLGIGANTAVWSVARPLMLDLLPVREPEQLIAIDGGTVSGTRSDDAFGRDVRIFSVPMYERLRDGATRPESALEDLAAASSFVGTAYWRRDGAPSAEALNAQLVSGNYFDVLGVRPWAGRMLTTSDDVTPGMHPVAVVAHAFAQRVLGADAERGGADVVGRELRLGDRSYTVVGVAQPGFSGEIVERRTDLWVPLAMEAELMAWPARRQLPDVMWLRLLGRLRPGRAPEAASTELTAVFRAGVQAEAEGHLSEDAAAKLERQQLAVVPLARGLSSLRGGLGRSLGLLGAVVALVLLIACANVANLLLARAKAREREMAARLALGAPRRRLVRQLLIEGLLLATLGGLAGLLIAAWGGRVLLALLVGPDTMLGASRWTDARLLLFCGAVSLLTVLLFGLLPALRATRLHLAPTLRGGGAAAAGRRWLLGRGLVAVQTGLSLVLLIGAGLFLRSLANLEQASPGYRADGILVASIDPRGAGYNEDEEGSAPRLAELHRRLVAGLEADPAVARASLSRYPLHEGSGSRTSVYGDGGDQAGDDHRYVRFVMATEGYFETLELPLLLGRTFDSHDRAESPKVAVVTRAMALEYFGEVEVVGRRFGYDETETQEVEIVGVVEDFVVQDLRDDPLPILFLSATQDPVELRSVEVRLRDPQSLGAAVLVRRILREVAPELPVRAVRPLRDLLRDTYRPQRSLAVLLGAFGALALLLTAIGLYGVLAFAVGRRLRELGIRVAIGADRRSIATLVLADAARLVGVGLLGGAAAALLANRWVATFLFRLAPTDPLSILLACLTFVVVAALAAWLPARRAARLEPTAVLRHE